MGKALTVVIPAYNAEKYLKTCLDSLCGAGALEELEILVVDDGSTDGTGEIADLYQIRFPGTVRAVHKPNGGHGSGINTGICLASGKYFKVVDADDWVDSSAFSELLRYLLTQDADAVISGYYWVFDKGTGDEERDKFRRRAEIREQFHGIQYKKTYRFDEVADKIYIKMHGLTIRTEILKKNAIRIDEHCYYVDTELILYPIPYIETIAFIKDFVYMYRIGRAGQSMQPERMRRNLSQYDKVLRSLFRFYRRLDCSDEKKAYIEGILARIWASRVKILLGFPPSEKARKELVEKEYWLRNRYPKVYRANIQPALRVLRLCRYILYYPASFAFRAGERMR